MAFFKQQEEKSPYYWRGTTKTAMSKLLSLTERFHPRALKVVQYSPLESNRHPDPQAAKGLAKYAYARFADGEAAPNWPAAVEQTEALHGISATLSTVQ